MKPPLRPVVWSPPPVDRRIGPPTTLPTLRLIALPALGEDVVVAADGQLFAGLVDGRIVRVDPNSGASETLAYTGGRPLGLELDAEGRLIVCDSKRGLLRVDPRARKVELLVDAAAQRLGFCNNAAVARDGSIYFSDSSRRFGIEHWRGELIEHSGTGRLFKRWPDGRLELLLDGLQFANGVALSSDESFVAVAETGGYCVQRVWLTGEKRGQRDMLIEGLPGFPDNMASDDAGRIWVALASPRNPLLDLLSPAPPLLRRIAWQLPDAIQPKPDRYMRVLALDDSGRVVCDLGGRDRTFHMITGMRAFQDKLYLASLEEPALAVIPLP